MTKEVFLDEIERMTAGRCYRDRLSEAVYENPELYFVLLEQMNKIDEKSSWRASWIFQLVSEKHLDWLIEEKKAFIKLLPRIKFDGVIRTCAKLCAILSEKFINEDNSIFSKKEIEIIVTCAFDWLIDPKLNVAPKVHSMQTIFNFRKHISWSSNELTLILEQEYNQGSAGYKSRARKILNELKKEG